MNKTKLIDRCDKLMAFSFYALIFFLPISIALTESFSGLALAAFLLKRGIVYSCDLQALSWKKIPIRWSERFILLLKAYRPKESYLDKPLAIFVLINFLSVLGSQYINLSLKGFFFKLLQGVYIYFTFIECIKTKKQIKIFSLIFLFSAGLIVLNGLVQYYTGRDFMLGYSSYDGRVISVFRHPNDLGA